MTWLIYLGDAPNCELAILWDQGETALQAASSFYEAHCPPDNRIKGYGTDSFAELHVGSFCVRVERRDVKRAA